MYITSSYIGTSIEINLTFYLLLQDYIEAEIKYLDDFSSELKRFAREIGNDGALVIPFKGDIENTRKHILDKPWSLSEKESFRKTPGLLILNKPFDDFNPRVHSWMYFSFNVKESEKNAEALKELAILIHENAALNVDFFAECNKLRRKYILEGHDKIFEVKPDVFGFSIDIISGIKYLALLIKHR